MKGKSGDKFDFKAPRGGMYKFCFHNPYGAPETVSFYIHVGHIPNEHNLAKDGQCTDCPLRFSASAYSFKKKLCVLSNNQFDWFM